MPAQPLQEIGRGGESVVFAFPQIAAAVTIVINRVLEKDGGHELGLAHGAGPGTFHLAGFHIAGLNDAQSVHQLAGKVIAPTAFARQGAECIQYRDAAQKAAVIGFQPPESNQVMAGDAVFAGECL